MIPLSVIWFFLYYKYPKYRKAMIVAGIISGTLGVVSEQLMYHYDWWKTISIFNNRWTIIEDFIVAGTNGGFAVVIWSICTGQHFEETLSISKETIFRLMIFWIIGLLFPYSMYLLGIHSFVAEIITYNLFLLTIFIKERDLFPKAIISSLIITAGTVPFYLLIQLIFPTYSQEHYFLDKLSGITFINIPIEDFVWYLNVNVILFVFYHYIFESKFQSNPINYKNIKHTLQKFLNFKQVVDI
jgi:hypothetical protein